MTWQRLPRIHDAAHDKARREWAARHDPSDLCVRCRHPLGPMGSHLHLDHHDVDKRIYLGFSHAKCNTDAGGARGRATQKARAAARKSGVVTLRRPAAPRRWY